MQQRTISNRSVAAMTVERDTVFWDRTVTGLRGPGLSDRRQGPISPKHGGRRGRSG